MNSEKRMTLVVATIKVTKYLLAKENPWRLIVRVKKVKVQKFTWKFQKESNTKIIKYSGN